MSGGEVDRWGVLRVRLTLAAVAVVALIEAVRRGELSDPLTVPGARLDFAPFLPLLVAGAIAAWRWPVHRTAPATGDDCPVRLGPMLALVGLAAWWASGTAWLLVPFDTIAYHDEASYRFQAETFAAGRLTADGLPDAPGLLDQMHVVSGPVRFSRYFPGTGVWLAPFVLAGVPSWGWIAAHVLAAVLAAMAGVELARGCGRDERDARTAGGVAGLLMATSAGLVAMSTHYLAHHPTLVGLTLFLWQTLRAMRTRSRRSFAIAGCGLTFAMLCRPMTAAGVALPFGVALLLRWVRRRDWKAAAAMAGPIVGGFVLLAAYNAAATGDALLTPYTVYNRVHTPRHGYGFGNGTRGEAVRNAMTPAESRRLMTAYDDWATDHTPGNAWANQIERTDASLRLAIGFVPSLLVIGLLLTRGTGWRSPAGLIAASIVSLHALHVPYWFVGIDGWHYVLESTIGWALLAGLLTADVMASAAVWLRRGWIAVLGVAAALAVVSMPPLWVAESTLLMARSAEIREQYAQANVFVTDQAGGRPVIVGVVANPTAPHYDYIQNGPSLSAPVVWVRIRDESDWDDVRAAFPDRLRFQLDTRRTTSDGEAFWRRID